LKIWNSFGSEHSMNLRMIGRFKDERDARKVDEIIERLRQQLQRDDIEFGAGEDQRYSEGVSQLLREIGLHTLGSYELEQLLYEGTVIREGANIVIRTDEIDVSAFLKILVGMGGRVEVYSADDYPDAESERDQAPGSSR
jgi:hypothetical protein